jgi:hypothetical protein
VDYTRQAYKDGFLIRQGSNFELKSLIVERLSRRKKVTLAIQGKSDDYDPLTLLLDSEVVQLKTEPIKMLGLRSAILICSADCQIAGHIDPIMRGLISGQPLAFQVSENESSEVVVG